MGTNASSALNSVDREALSVDCAVDNELDEAEWVKVELEEARNSFVIAVGMDESLVDGTPLDEEAFPCFASLLAASQAYASHSGCRFRGSDFSDVSSKETVDAVGHRHAFGSGVAHGDGETVGSRRLAARLQAAPAVSSFAERIRGGDRELVEEMTRAYDVVMSESVRNAMVAAFRELSLWPPSPAPEGVGDDDCDFEDLSAPIPVIAQRIYNDEAHRRRDLDLHGGSGCGRLFQRAATASYLVDFVYETGVQLPADAGERHVSRLQRFGDRVAEWEREAATPPPVVESSENASLQCDDCDDLALATGSDSAIAAATFDDCSMEAAKWWSHCWREAFWAFTSSVLLSATASASISILRRSLRGGHHPSLGQPEETWIEKEPMQEMSVGPPVSGDAAKY